ncbi:MAG: TlpA family protein disulfide reductase [Betaproteobacteria bacterium]|nr:TlpA family protein disulfide reductase [Betaproteobacteria bacterium]
MSKRRAVALLAVVAVASGAGGYAVSRWWLRRDAAGRAPDMPEAVAKAVFSTRLADLQGGARTLEPWRGRVLVVNFWATWCAPCREEIPVFVRMQERYGAQGLQFVGVAIDQPDKVADFAREFQINYPVLLGGLETLELVRLVGNRAGVLPYTLVIDRAGNIASRELGGLKEARLYNVMHPLL